MARYNPTRRVNVALDDLDFADKRKVAKIAEGLRKDKSMAKLAKALDDGEEAGEYPSDGGLYPNGPSPDELEARDKSPSYIAASGDDPAQHD